MNFNFTDGVRADLGQAREEAIRLRHEYVGTEHLLLGLIKAGHWPTWLSSSGPDGGTVCSRVEESVRKGKTAITMGELPYTSRAKKVLEYSMAEAKDLSNSSVGTEHLLLGLLREEKGIAAQVLESLGVSLEDVRAHVQQGSVVERATFVIDGREASEPDAAASFEFSIDDASTSSIYEQIIAQVNEAVATGALRPGQRLPTVRRLADELDIAPGTVARAYSELERLGVLKTEGARGTRVAERPREPQPPDERRETLVGLLRPVAVAAFHLGATATELRQALDRAMGGVLREDKPKES